MSEAERVQELSRPLEGGVFYPAGYMVVGLARHSDAEDLCQLFRQAGYDDNDCLVVPPATMLATAREDLRSSSVIAILGSSLQVRQRQIELAREGCSFLLIYAPSEAEKTRVLRVLERVPVRYAIHYHRFTIEDLIKALPSAQDDARTARTAGVPDR
jgi:hypothetical protein